MRALVFVLVFLVCDVEMSAVAGTSPDLLLGSKSQIQANPPVASPDLGSHSGLDLLRASLEVL